MATIYELTDEYRNVLELLDSDEWDPESVEGLLAEIAGDIEEKVENYGKIIRMLEADVAAEKAEEKRIHDRRASREAKIAYLKKTAEYAMRACGRQKIKTPLFTFSIQKNPASVVIDDMTAVPEEYIIPQEPKIDKTAIKEAIKAGAKFGFPVTGIKQSIIMGAKRAGLDVVGTELKGSFFLTGATAASTSDVAEIVTSKEPVMREDMVMVGGMSKSADIRFRPEFTQWEIPLIIKYNMNGKYSLEQILNCVNAGGFACGIGEWRPEKDGQHGMYSLKTSN